MYRRVYGGSMFVSIVVCTHSLDNLQNLMDAVDSLLNQTHKEIEILVVVDGNRELYERIVEIYDVAICIVLLQICFQGNRTVYGYYLIKLYTDAMVLPHLTKIG